jgi:Flp pilus assembly protein TadB
MLPKEGHYSIVVGNSIIGIIILMENSPHSSICSSVTVAAAELICSRWQPTAEGAARRTTWTYRALDAGRKRHYRALQQLFVVFDVVVVAVVPICDTAGSAMMARLLVILVLLWWRPWRRQRRKQQQKQQQRHCRLHLLQ